jgi:hypothetical protein
MPNATTSPIEPATGQQPPKAGINCQAKAAKRFALYQSLIACFATAQPIVTDGDTRSSSTASSTARRWFRYCALRPVSKRKRSWSRFRWRRYRASVECCPQRVQDTRKPCAGCPDRASRATVSRGSPAAYQPESIRSGRANRSLTIERHGRTRRCRPISNADAQAAHGKAAGAAPFEDG